MVTEWEVEVDAEEGDVVEDVDAEDVEDVDTTVINQSMVLFAVSNLLTEYS